MLGLMMESQEDSLSQQRAAQTADLKDWIPLKPNVCYVSLPEFRHNHRKERQPKLARRASFMYVCLMSHSGLYSEGASTWFNALLSSS